MSFEPVVQVLDKGYVRLITWTHFDMVSLVSAIESGDIEAAKSLVGMDDLSVVNAAKASYNRASTTYGSQETRLMSFLGRAGHPAPLRHAHVTFEVKAPMMVARQWFKYRIGSTHNLDSLEQFDVSDLALYPVSDEDPLSVDSARNEASRRYIRGYEWYDPDSWRSQPANAKQGSGGSLPSKIQSKIKSLFSKSLAVGESFMDEVNDLLKGEIGEDAAIASEQFRGFLPCAYNLYTSWRWTASLDSVLHFIRQRKAGHAQYEIRQYATAVEELLVHCYPGAVESFGAYPEIDVIHGLLKLLQENAPELCEKGASAPEVRKARAMLHHIE